MRKRFFYVTKLLLVVSFVIGIAALGFGCSKYSSKAGSISVEELVNNLKAKDDYVTLNNISNEFKDAIVAIEDRRFYTHGALDPIAIVRATVNNIKAGKVIEGGSTITQQLAKNLCLTNEVTMDRKFTEMFLAFELERNYSKEEILELYVNVIYYGDGNTGIKQASEGYFGKDPSKLSYKEATMLAGLPQSPSAYALSKHPEVAKKRQQQVIAALEKYNSKNTEKEVNTVVLQKR